MDYKHLREVLQEFCVGDVREVPTELDKVLEDTAQSGVVRFSWDLMKPLVRSKFQTVLDCGFEGQECKEDEGLCDHLLDQLDKFDNPPFTIQRVCELITEPRKHYRKIGAYMRAMERNLLVVSTQEPDLTWMKSPRLTQLLVEPVETAHAEDSTTHTLRAPSDQHSSSAQLDDTRLSSNGGSESRDEYTRLSSNNGGDATRQVSVTTQESSPSEQQNGTSVIESCLSRELVGSRKRKSCERDEIEGATPHCVDNDEVTVLQEADSTTTVDSDESSMDTDPTSPPSSLETSAAKRCKSESSLRKDSSDSAGESRSDLVSSALDKERYS